MPKNSRLSCEADTIDRHDSAIDHPDAWTVASIDSDSMNRSRLLNVPQLLVIIPTSAELNFEAALVTEAKPCQQIFVSTCSIGVRVRLHVKSRMLTDVGSAFVVLGEGRECNRTPVSWSLSCRSTLQTDLIKAFSAADCLI